MYLQDERNGRFLMGQDLPFFLLRLLALTASLLCAPSPLTGRAGTSLSNLLCCSDVPGLQLREES